MLTPYLPYPPASGGQIRTLNLLKYLSKNHSITLIALYKNDKEKKYASYLESYCDKIYVCKRAEKPWQPRNILKSIFSSLPFLIVRNFSVEAKRVVETLLREQSFDIIHAETFYIMPHIPKTNIPIFLLEQTIEYKVYQHFTEKLPLLARPFFYPDIIKLKSSEIFYWKKASVVGTVSDYDKHLIHKIAPTINPVIIPNGAGDDMFVDKLAPKDIKKPTFLFVGNFYWLQNIEAAQYIMNNLYPKLKHKKDIVIIIAGQNASVKLKPSVHKNIKIIDIPQDDATLVKRLYHEATLFVAPIYGPGGTRLKILAAMASGLPVISTKTGVEGLGVTDEEHVLVADNEIEFENKIEMVLSDKHLYEKLRKNAYNLAKESYSWNSISQKLEVVYKSVIDKHEPGN
ncbi:MAG: hypothetical protein RI947_1052 [Candidatus Parcubacteria bacterium]|jgi:glycosyltransferase involved in cell wall biosynthesis